MRSASRQGGGRHRRRLQETAPGTRRAGGKARGKEEARKGRQGCEGRKTETEAGAAASVTAAQNFGGGRPSRAISRHCQGRNPPAPTFARGCCFRVIYFNSNIPLPLPSIAPAAPAWKPPG